MIRGLIVAAGGLLLAGCAVTHQTVSGPDGRPAYVMKCSGMGRDRQDCLKEAGRLCPTGYMVVDDDRRIAGGMMIGSVLAVANREYLTVSCK